LEITSILDMYRTEENLNLEVLPRGTVWLDCGTVASLNDASNYIRVIEERQGFKVGCIEEIAWRKGWISTDQLIALGKNFGPNEYGRYLLRIAR